MENTRLKNVLVAAGVAIFSGVLLLGVNAAIGASTPTAEPPGVGVSPTFTGLNVNGNVQNSAGDLAVSDNLAVTGNVSASGNFAVTGTSDLQGNVSDSGGSFTIGDNLAVTGTSDLQGNVSDSGGSFTIGDNLAVTGTSDLQGNVSDSGGSFTIGDNLAVTGTSDLQGNVSDSGGDFTVGDNLAVTGTSDLQGNVRDSGGSFIVDDNMTVTGNQQVDGTLTVSNDANMNGNFTVGASDPSTARIITLNGNTSIKFDTLMSGDLDLHGGLKNGYSYVDPVKGTVEFSLWIDDDVSVSGDVNVNGAVMASRFGTYTPRPSTAQRVPDQWEDGSNDFEHAEASKSCNGGEILVSCGGYASTSSASYGWTRWVTFDRIESTANTCYVGGTNTSDSLDRYITAVAICLNPNL